MNILKKISEMKKELEEIKEEEKKQESWYNDLHESSIGHTGAMSRDGGSGILEFGITRSIAQK